MGMYNKLDKVVNGVVAHAINYNDPIGMRNLCDGQENDIYGNVIPEVTRAIQSDHRAMELTVAKVKAAVERAFADSFGFTDKQVNVGISNAVNDICDSLGVWN